MKRCLLALAGVLLITQSAWAACDIASVAGVYELVIANGRLALFSDGTALLVVGPPPFGTAAEQIFRGVFGVAIFNNGAGRNFCDVSADFLDSGGQLVRLFGTRAFGGAVIFIQGWSDPRLALGMVVREDFVGEPQ